MYLHYGQVYNKMIIILIMPTSHLVKLPSSFQSSWVLFSPYRHQYRYEKQVPFCSHNKSLLYLGHMMHFKFASRDV